MRPLRAKVPGRLLSWRRRALRAGVRVLAAVPLVQHEALLLLPVAREWQRVREMQRARELQGALEWQRGPQAAAQARGVRHGWSTWRRPTSATVRRRSDP